MSKDILKSLANPRIESKKISKNSGHIANPANQSTTTPNDNKATPIKHPDFNTLTTRQNTIKLADHETND